MEDSPAIRLKLFIDTSGLTTTQFADMCGIPRPSLSQILSGRNKKISDVFIGQIHRAFPDLSVMWLLFGEGPVRTSDPKSSSSIGEAPASALEKSILNVEGVQTPQNTLFQSARNEEIRPVAQSANENSNLSELRNANLQPNLSNNQVFESDLKIMDLQRQIDQMRQNPRKVVQITIYYDDSTFETFTPKS